MSEFGGLAEILPYKYRHMYLGSILGSSKFKLRQNHLKKDETLKMATKNEKEFLVWGVLRGKKVPAHLDRHSWCQKQRVEGVGNSDRPSRASHLLSLRFSFS